MWRLKRIWQNVLRWWRIHSRIGDDIAKDVLLGLRGSGKELWKDEHADEYVRRLRGCCD